MEVFLVFQLLLLWSYPLRICFNLPCKYKVKTEPWKEGLLSRRTLPSIWSTRLYGTIVLVCNLINTLVKKVKGGVEFILLWFSDRRYSLQCSSLYTYYCMWKNKSGHVSGCARTWPDQTLTTEIRADVYKLRSQILSYETE